MSEAMRLHRAVEREGRLAQAQATELSSDATRGILAELAAARRAAAIAALDLGAPNAARRLRLALADIRACQWRLSVISTRGSDPTMTK